jgi:phosphatidylserine/phosphatidylglycerophosphate/cardiolipin synthase-like enzyme
VKRRKLRRLIDICKLYLVVLFLCIVSLKITLTLYGEEYLERESFEYKKYEKEPFYLIDNISIKVYFCPRDNCSEIFINLLNNAKSIKCLFYDLNLENISEIIKTKNNFFIGVYAKNLKSNYYGLTPINTGYVMHNKYCILDGEVVITGSTNPTYRDVSLNNNNLIVIKSKKAAEFYLNDLFSIANFSNFNNREYPKINEILKNASFVEISDSFNTTSIKICFSPIQNCRNLIVETLNKSKNKIYFMTFTFTDNYVGDILAKKKKEGIVVEGIVEKKFYSRTPEVIRNSISNDTNPYNLHHKVFLVDDNIVITGSFNPSYNALKNFENVVVIKSFYINNLFHDEFFMLKDNK